MDLRTVKKLQREYGVSNIQARIVDGSIWSFEGSVGRQAMNLLDSGVCFLGTEPTSDYYGSRIPSRKQVEEGTKGSRTNAIKFWERVMDGDFEYIDYLNSL